MAPLALAIVAAAPPALRFEQAFATTSGPKASQATILYRGRDGIHRLRITRAGETRVRRDTDDRLTAVAQHRPGETGYRLDLFDHVRRIHTVVDRDSLYRVGRFTDWIDLAHGLRHPSGAYGLKAAGDVHAPITPVGPCRWFALDQAGHRSTICWSTTEALPLLILDDRGRLVWRVMRIDHRPSSPSIFAPNPMGYVLADAAADISGD